MVFLSVEHLAVLVNGSSSPTQSPEAPVFWFGAGPVIALAHRPQLSQILPTPFTEQYRSSDGALSEVN